jgi:ubiquinone/menaquinone biosynthesis C-methylase UbiE
MTYQGSELIKAFVPDDSCKQMSSIELVEELLKKYEFENVMDLGCGIGNSVDFFRSKQQDIKWIGLDLNSSPEVNLRIRDDVNFYTYDGINIPFPDNYFDLIYCHQVFEHVERPFELM